MNLELLKTITILYVEDEVLLRNDIYENISPFVKEVIVGADGEEGLELFLQHRDKIDLIISDILMPKMTGIEMLDEVRKIDEDIPVIYTTAFSDSEYMKRTIEQNVLSYIVKPIDIELLLKGIEKASIKVENERLKLSLLKMNEELEEKVKIKTHELKEQNDKLLTQLYTDELTSILNRKALFRDIEDLDNPILSVIDIDSFKSINDLYGESIGNAVLVSVAEILTDCASVNNSSAYRIGSDVFAILQNEKFSLNKSEEQIKNIIKTINEKIIYLDKYKMSLRVDVTVGIATQKEDILEKADMALKKAKLNKYQYLIYSDEHNLDEEYKNDVKWTQIIQNAIENNHIAAYYQPIVDVNKNILKYECLIRIVENDKVHSPVLFLDIAKKAKFYPQLTKIMIKKAFDKAKETGLKISVNLSIEDISNAKIIGFVKDELIKSGVAKLIIFEILESENISDYAEVISFIDMVKELGSDIAIDDFGSGYSNFSYLLKLKPDYIKIDGSSVKNIDSDEKSYLITKTINDFAHSLGIKTIAEYVHTQEVFETVKSLGIDEYQGYYFSAPLAKI